MKPLIVIDVCRHGLPPRACRENACPVCGRCEVGACYMGEAICSSCFAWLDNLNTIGLLAGRIWEGITGHGPGRIPPCCWRIGWERSWRPSASC